MKCPQDNATLVMSERSGVEIDYCPECRGIWLDRGELDKILERAEAQIQAAAPVAPAAPPVAPQQPPQPTAAPVYPPQQPPMQPYPGAMPPRGHYNSSPGSYPRGGYGYGQQPYGQQPYRRKKGGWLGELLG